MMTKLEYLKILENGLKLRLGRAEVDEIMRDYAEYFVEGKKQGKSDFEIAYNLGDPKEVANQIVSESLGRQNGFSEDAAYHAPAGKRVKEAAKTAMEGAGRVTGSCAGAIGKILMGILVIVLIPVALVVGGTVLAVVGTLFAGLFGLMLCCVGVIVAAICIIMAICLCVGVLPASGVGVLSLVATGLISGAVLGLSLLTMLLCGIWRLLMRGVHWSKCQVNTHRRPRPMPDGWEDPLVSGNPSPQGAGQETGETAAVQQEPDIQSDLKEGEHHENP